MLRLSQVVAEPAASLKVFLQSAGVPPSENLIDNIYTTAMVLKMTGRLDEEDEPLLNDENFWRYLAASTDLFKGLTQWKAISKNRSIILYIEPESTWYVDSIKNRLFAAGIRLIESRIPKPSSYDTEVFLLTGEITKLEEKIKSYGDFCTIIAIDDITVSMGRRKGDLLPEYFTLTSYSPEWLEEYLLKPYPSEFASMTYTVSGFSGIIGGYLHMLLRGWKLVYKPHGFVDYLSHNTLVTGLRDTALNTIKTGIRNVADVRTTEHITDKSRLYETFQKLDPNQKFVLPSKDLEDSDTMASLNMGDVVIIRPVGPKAFQGKGISVVTNDDELAAARDEIKRNRNWKNATVSPYIRNPFLYQRRKFHLRIAVLVTSWGTTALYHRADGMVAKLPYIDADYSNKDIHDTHLSSTDFFFIFPEHFDPEIRKRMQEGIKGIFDLITKAVKGRVRSYPESEFGFDVLGLDIMFTPEGQAILIEINTNAGFNVIFESTNKNQYFQWYEEINKWIFDNTIAKYINATNPLKLTLIEKATENDLKQLSVITTNKSDMKWIERGDIWDYEKLTNLANTAREEMKSRGNETTDRFEGNRRNETMNKKYFDWVVSIGDRVVGYVSIRPINQKLFSSIKTIKGIKLGDPQIRILIGEKGQGYGSKSLVRATREYWRVAGSRVKIWALVKITNKASISLFTKAGWQKYPQVTIHGDKHFVFSTF